MLWTRTDQVNRRGSVKKLECSFGKIGLVPLKRLGREKDVLLNQDVNSYFWDSLAILLPYPFFFFNLFTLLVIINRCLAVMHHRPYIDTVLPSCEKKMVTTAQCVASCMFMLLFFPFLKTTTTKNNKNKNNFASLILISFNTTVYSSSLFFKIRHDYFLQSSKAR